MAQAADGANGQRSVRSPLSRRQVLIASAWSVPVISVGAAAPALAASPVPFLTIEPSACQYANGGLALLLHLNNESDASKLLQVGQLLFNTSQRAVVGVQPSVNPITPALNCVFLAETFPTPTPSFGVAPGSSKVILYTTPGTPPSTGGLVTLQYSVFDLGLIGITMQQTVTVAPQGTSTCALDDPAVNPCAPLFTGA